MPAASVWRFRFDADLAGGHRHGCKTTSACICVFCVLLLYI